MLRGCLLLILVLLGGALQAQIGRAGSTISAAGDASTNDGIDTSATKGLVYNVEPPDSVTRRKVFIFGYHPTRVKIEHLSSPSLDPTGAQFYDAIDALNGNYYLNTGVVGHPHLALYPTLTDGLKPRLQADENAVYAKRPDNIRLYQTLSPYTRLSYGSSLNNDYTLRIIHSQNILPGWNAAIDYALICPDGVFTNSGAKNHYLDFTTNYFSRDSRLQAAAGLIMDSYTIGENGGLTADSYFTDGAITNFSGLPVVIDDSSARHERRHFFGKMSYNMVRQYEHYRYRDSIVAVIDSLSADSISFDTITLTDTLRVSDPTIINRGVVGFAADWHQQKRWMSQEDLFIHQSATLFWTNDAYADHRWHNPVKFTLGLRQDYLRFDLGNVSLSSSVRFSPFASTEIAIGRSRVSAEGEVSYAQSGFTPLGSRNPDQRIMASYSIALDSARHTIVLAKATLQRKLPDLRMLHDANFALKTLKDERYELQFTYDPSSPDDHRSPIVDLTLCATHLSHNSWYDSLRSVVQGSDPFWVYQANLTMRLSWRWLHLDMQQLLQHSGDGKQLPLPRWASKNSLYVDFIPIKNALRVQVGCDVRYHTPFHADSYDPHTGLFLRQDIVDVGGQMWFDAFINLQVKRATIFVKGGHLNTLWDDTHNYFLLPHYPGQKFGLFWGITWHFFD